MGLIQKIKRSLGITASPLAVYTDATESFRVRYELFPRFISRAWLFPRKSDFDALFFMPGFLANPTSISKSIELSVRERPAQEQKELDAFLNRAVECVRQFEREGIPAFAPMATPGINDIFFTKGQEFTTNRRIPVDVWVSYYAPRTGGGPGHLPAGVRIRIAQDSEDFTTKTQCAILEPSYSALEKSLVSREELDEELYAGYSVLIENKTLREMCTP